MSSVQGCCGMRRVGIWEMLEEDLANKSKRTQESGRLARDGRIVYQQEFMRHEVLQYLDDACPTSIIEIPSSLSGRL
jgi:hypothetical protein